MKSHCQVKVLTVADLHRNKRLIAQLGDCVKRHQLPGAEKNSRSTGGLKMDFLRLRFLDPIH